jgi:hypothetical protein
MVFMRMLDPMKQAKLREKLKSLERKRDGVHNKCEAMTSVIGTLLQNLLWLCYCWYQPLQTL